MSRLVDALLAEKFSLSVDNGSDEPSLFSSDKNHSLSMMGDTDEDYLNVRNSDGVNIGHVYLVYGNDGWDVISDYAFSKKYYPILKKIISGIDTESFTVTLV